MATAAVIEFGSFGYGRCSTGFEGIVRNAVLDQVRMVASTGATVLIERPNRPFVNVNCAAIPAELLESELFGHPATSDYV